MVGYISSDGPDVAASLPVDSTAWPREYKPGNQPRHCEGNCACNELAQPCIEPQRLSE